MSYPYALNGHLQKNIFSYLLVNNKNEQKKKFFPAYFDKNANTHGRANRETFFC